MPSLRTDLEPGDVVLIPAGAGASIEFVEKSGRRSRVRIDCDAPVTVTKRNESAQSASGVAAFATPAQQIARRPVARAVQK